MGSFQVTLTPADMKRLGIKPKKVKTDKAAWPDKVPVLTAKDICKGTFTKKAKHDLTGWRNETFLGPGKQMSSDGDKILMKVTIEIRRAIAAACPFFNKKMQISEFNDASGTTPAQIAEVWNKAMLSLGYDAEGNRKKK